MPWSYSEFVFEVERGEEEALPVRLAYSFDDVAACKEEADFNLGVFYAV